MPQPWLPRCSRSQSHCRAMGGRGAGEQGWRPEGEGAGGTSPAAATGAGPQEGGWAPRSPSILRTPLRSHSPAQVCPWESARWQRRCRRPVSPAACWNQWLLEGVLGCWLHGHHGGSMGSRGSFPSRGDAEVPQAPGGPAQAWLPPPALLVLPPDPPGPHGGVSGPPACTGAPSPGQGRGHCAVTEPCLHRCPQSPPGAPSSTRAPSRATALGSLAFKDSVRSIWPLEGTWRGGGHGGGR